MCCEKKSLSQQVKYCMIPLIHSTQNGRIHRQKVQLWLLDQGQTESTQTESTIVVARSGKGNGNY